MIGGMFKCYHNIVMMIRIMRMLTSSMDNAHSGMGSEVWLEKLYLQNPFLSSVSWHSEMAALWAASHSQKQYSQLAMG